MFQEYRKELKIIFNNLGALVSVHNVNGNCLDIIIQV